MNVNLRWVVISIKRYCVLSLVVVIIVLLLWSYTLNMRSPKMRSLLTFKTTTSVSSMNTNNDIILTGNIFSNSELRAKMLKQRVERLSRNIKKSRSIYLNSKPMLQPNYNVHIFYYAWYGNPRMDGFYKHWNHTYLPNWKRDDRKVYPTGYHEAPIDIGSNFYPKLGCYSSKDSNVIKTHMEQIRNAGIGVVILSWAPPNLNDSPHTILPELFDTALKFNVKIALHIEPYFGRNPVNLLDYIKSFLNNYKDHPALYKIKKPMGKKKVPVFYIYDSYLIPDVAWRELLSKKGNLSIRNTEFDCVFIGLLVDLSHRSHIKKSQFDGFYTYFASNSFTYGSTWKNWRSLSKFAVQNGLIFIPSVGPGYIDTQIRPWNSVSTRHRRHGQYYDVAWRSAINNNANYVSITSFNEWHEGTQIEPAQPKNILGFTYLDYEPEGYDFYLNLTKWWIQQFEKSAS